MFKIKIYCCVCLKPILDLSTMKEWNHRQCCSEECLDEFKNYAQEYTAIVETRSI